MKSIVAHEIGERDRRARRNALARRLSLALLAAWAVSIAAALFALYQPASPPGRALLNLRANQNIDRAAQSRSSAAPADTSDDPIFRGGHEVPGITLIHLDRLTVGPEYAEGYERDDWLHWIRDAEGCLDTRDYVLAEESLQAPVVDNCNVVGGRWFDPYTATFFDDPGSLDIDHLVPLSEAHRSGAAIWSADKKAAFANSVDEPWALIAVDRSANRSKGGRDPADWMPPHTEFHCAYARMWIAVKLRWTLSVDPDEKTALAQALATCPTTAQSEYRQ